MVITPKTSFRAQLASTGKQMGLTDRAIEELARSAQLARWRKNQDIFGAEDPSDLVNFLVSGVVKVTCPAGDGTVCVQLVRPGQFFGPNWYPERDEPRLFGARAFTDCVVAIITSEMLSKVITDSPPASVLRMLALSWRILSRLLYDKCQLLGQGLEDRLRHELAVLGRDFGEPSEGGLLIGLPLTHADLAELAIASRANVARTMKRLERQGAIRKQGRRILLTGGFLASLPQRQLASVDTPLERTAG